MNPFRHGFTFNTDIQDIELKLVGGVDVTPATIFWFKPYLSADFPELVCDKKYWFMYSTDHASGDGGIYWGKGNNLDLSDFQEVAAVLTGYQAETAFPMHFPGNPEPIHIYYHTRASEPGNDGVQRTRLITTVGGAELHNCTFTDRDRPLPLLENEVHNGYFKAWQHPTDVFRGMHLATLDPGGQSNQQIAFVTTIDGLTFQRDGLYNLTQGMPAGFKSKPTYGDHFEMYNQNWFLGTIEDGVGGVGGTSVDKKLALCKTNSDLQITETVAVLNNGEYTRNYEVYRENDIAHLYFQNPSEKLYYATYDLANLESFT